MWCAEYGKSYCYKQAKYSHESTIHIYQWFSWPKDYIQGPLLHYFQCGVQMACAQTDQIQKYNELSDCFVGFSDHCCWFVLLCFQLMGDIFPCCTEELASSRKGNVSQHWKSGLGNKLKQLSGCFVAHHWDLSGLCAGSQCQIIRPPFMLCSGWEPDWQRSKKTGNFSQERNIRKAVGGLFF